MLTEFQGLLVWLGVAVLFSVRLGTLMHRDSLTWVTPFDRLAHPYSSKTKTWFIFWLLWIAAGLLVVGIFTETA